LARQKGFDILIHAFARIANRHSEWTVEIAGEGPEREVLEKLIAAKGLQKRVRLLGLVNDPEPLYRRSDIFVLSSRHEAYPMVLCEAMSAGCCIVATDCPTGPREIIGTSEAALLVPPEDDQLLAAALERLLQSPLERAMRRISATHRVQELTPAAIMAQWDLAVERWCDVRS
jgi:glycosyltransferase involved in cell wall biosynthesis